MFVFLVIYLNNRIKMFYKEIKQINELYWIHTNTWQQRRNTWRIQEVVIDWKVVWYYDVYELNVKLAQIIENINNKRKND